MTGRESFTVSEFDSKRQKKCSLTYGKPENSSDENYGSRIESQFFMRTDAF